MQASSGPGSVRLIEQEVRVVSGVPVGSPLTLVTPKGHRLEGLVLGQALELLRRLG